MATEGKDTTEYQRVKSSGIWGIVGMVLGGLIALSPLIMAWPADSVAYIVGGATVSIAGIAQKTLVDLGYIAARSDLKKKLPMILIPVMVSSLMVSCSTIETEFVDADGTAFKTITTLGPFSKLDGSEAAMLYDWDGTGAGSAGVGSNSKGLDSTGQGVIIQIPLEVLMKQINLLGVTE